MKFVFGKQDMTDSARAQENCWLLGNGLGGFSSTTAAFSVTRNDHGILIAARTAPNDRVNLVHRLSEKLLIEGKEYFLSTQDFADGKPAEDGWRQLSSFTVEHGPKWVYEVVGVRVTRTVAVADGSNVAAICYRLENRTEHPCTLQITPWLQFAPKGNPPQGTFPLRYSKGKVAGNGLQVRIKTGARLEKAPVAWEKLDYAYDAKDGRPPMGIAASCCRITKTVEPGEMQEWDLIFSTEPTRASGKKLLLDQTKRLKKREKQGSFRHPVARQLAMAAAEFIASRKSTGGKTILAGYPFFGDWGRDTMIALPGCVLAREDYDTAKSILRTFLAYEHQGLVPNLFPEGESQPMYNTVDAALLLINSVWLYHRRHPDVEFIRESWPVMKNIIKFYREGTLFGIRMDSDGLIAAGEGFDQVTWMDVRIGDILPTPRHGKPVEINAYWYNALKIMENLAPVAGEDGDSYGKLAEKVANSFEKFWMEDRGYLKDVISGTSADEQLRCNQIWAVTMPFTVLSRKREKRVVDTVYRHLYTPVGLRTLSPEDPEFHPHYGGPQLERDLAYHQGTVWPFPLGAYYLAYLKVNDYSAAARQTLYGQLEALEAALREGCVGQLPEIYEGLNPGASQGCFAQAWSVGELLRVFEALEKGI